MVLHCSYGGAEIEHAPDGRDGWRSTAMLACFFTQIPHTHDDYDGALEESLGREGSVSYGVALRLGAWAWRCEV